MCMNVFTTVCHGICRSKEIILRCCKVDQVAILQLIPMFNTIICTYTSFLFSLLIHCAFSMFSFVLLPPFCSHYLYNVHFQCSHLYLYLLSVLVTYTMCIFNVLVCTYSENRQQHEIRNHLNYHKSERFPNRTGNNMKSERTLTSLGVNIGKSNRQQ